MPKAYIPSVSDYKCPRIGNLYKGHKIYIQKEAAFRKSEYKTRVVFHVVEPQLMTMRYRYRGINDNRVKQVSYIAHRIAMPYQVFRYEWTENINTHKYQLAVRGPNLFAHATENPFVNPDTYLLQSYLPNTAHSGPFGMCHGSTEYWGADYDQQEHDLPEKNFIAGALYSYGSFWGSIFNDDLPARIYKKIRATGLAKYVNLEWTVEDVLSDKLNNTLYGIGRVSGKTTKRVQHFSDVLAKNPVGSDRYLVTPGEFITNERIRLAALQKKQEAQNRITRAAMIARQVGCDCPMCR